MRQVRITAHSEPDPVVQRVIVGDVVDGGMLCEPALRAAALPMEFFVRELLELPIDPPDKTPLTEWLAALSGSEFVRDYLCEFTATHGLVCPHPSMAEPLTPVWATSADAWHRWTPLGIGLAEGFSSGLRYSDSFFRVPLVSLLEHLIAARTAVTHWLAWEDDAEDLGPIWSALRPRLDVPLALPPFAWSANPPADLPAEPVKRYLGSRLGMGAGREEQVAWLMFQHVVNGALAPLSPRLGVGFGDDAPADAPVVTVYTAAIWQLFEHIGESALTRKRCANPNCGRWFYRQRDRAAKGQHKTDGLKYCDARCARAVAQRELRRRRREESHGAR